MENSLIFMVIGINYALNLVLAYKLFVKLDFCE